MVLYDFPALQIQREKIVKGRYRNIRHQSPFCIKTQVEKAFIDLFEGLLKSWSNMVLSYSNTGMITIDKLYEIAKTILPNKKIEWLTKNHRHMTLGRKQDLRRNVKECLMLID
ncbi:MAG: hypothetical protein AAF403_01150 [Pseudomonadota bacterium]